jgi:hypothetical protein
MLPKEPTTNTRKHNQQKTSHIHPAPVTGQKTIMHWLYESTLLSSQTTPAHRLDHQTRWPPKWLPTFPFNLTDSHSQVKSSQFPQPETTQGQHDPKTQTPKSPSHTHDHQINQDLVGRPQRRVSATSTSSVSLPADPAYPPQPPHTKSRSRSGCRARYVARAEENSTATAGPRQIGRENRPQFPRGHNTTNIRRYTEERRHSNVPECRRLGHCHFTRIYPVTTRAPAMVRLPRRSTSHWPYSRSAGSSAASASVRRRLLR